MTISINEAFRQFKSDLELTKSLQTAITTHHNAIREWIESVDSSIETKLIGSLQRNTRIRPLDEQKFDIDILVVLGKFYNWVSSGGITPNDALVRVEEIVRDNGTYQQLGPETDSPAIVFEYSDNIKVELIPAYLDMIGRTPEGVSIPPVGRGYWIPKNGKWVIADYDYDAEYVSLVNSKVDGWLVPIIKMLKSAKRQHFDTMSSYHLEILALNTIPAVIDQWKLQGVNFDYPHLIYAFFLLAKDQLSNELRIPGSKCSSFGAQIDLMNQVLLPGKFQELFEKCRQALASEDSKAIEIWGEILDKPFPSEVKLWLINALKSS